MFKKFISMATAVLVMASGISFVGINAANAAGERTLTTASKVKGVIVTLGTPALDGQYTSPFVQGFVNLTAVQAADTSNAGNFVTEFIKTDPSATMEVALYPNADNGIGNPALFPGSGTQFNGSAALLNNQLIAIRVTSSINQNQNYWYQIAVRIVSSDATLSFANSRVKSVTPGIATANDDIAQLATSSNRTSITLTSAQASSTSGNQTNFDGSNAQAARTAKRFASSVSSLNSSVFDSATSVTSSTVFTNGDYIVIKVVAEDGTTTKYYGYSVTVTSSGGGGGGSICSSALLSNTSTIKGVTFTSGTRQASSTDFNGSGSSNMGSVSLTAAQASGNGATSIVATGGATATWLYVAPSINSWGNGDISTTANLVGVTVANGRLFEIKISGSDCTDYYRISIRVASVAPAPSTPEQIAAAAAAQVAAVAAAAQAAAAAAAVIRAAEIATAQNSLATILRGDKAGSQAEYRAANINVTTAASLTRLNAEVLKLSAADRADFAKIKALADRIEFDESFFNATARPSIATYTANGVTGVTERILPVMNAKILELPVALRTDIKAIQELLRVESFVDRVANTQTRASVSAAVLVSRGLLTAEYPRRHSVVRGLASYPEGSLNTMAKIEAAIKEQIAKAEAPKLRLAEIKAKIAARNK